MINMDLNQSVSINTNKLEWLKSPQQNVLRKKLERASEESGHTTSIVQYQPGAKFNRHSHPLGEEILVLDGVFSDEHGDYQKGTYLRNPPGSTHSPFSNKGCKLFVKLNQFLADDTSRICINTTNTAWLPGQGNLQVMPLHNFCGEHTALVKWPANERFQPHVHVGGEEIYVISGEFIDEYGSYPAGTWLRNPHMSKHFPYVREETVILVKVGHLKA